jgi:L-threonylcarbamoyladenylate synthase
MKTLSKEELMMGHMNVKDAVLDGEVFVYPTDTIYGIGCNALNKEAVDKIRKLKKREDDPFSVIAPSKEWILKHCEVSEEAQEWIDKLPGPYTLILKLKGDNIVAPNVNPGKDTIGVRIPDHWITNIVQELDVPIVTTSANQHGKIFMTSADNLDPEIRKGLHFMVYEGEIKGRPSKIVDLAGSKAQIKER